MFIYKLEIKKVNFINTYNRGELNMGHINGELNISPTSNTRKWKTNKEVTYTTDSGELILVPAGFVTDGASIPRALWWIVGHPYMGNYARAALVKDYLYVTAKLTKKEADLIFLDIMTIDGVKKWRRKVMYQAVKWFGKGNY